MTAAIQATQTVSHPIHGIGTVDMVLCCGYCLVRFVDRDTLRTVATSDLSPVAAD